MIKAFCLLLLCSVSWIGVAYAFPSGLEIAFVKVSDNVQAPTKTAGCLIVWGAGDPSTKNIYCRYELKGTGFFIDDINLSDIRLSFSSTQPNFQQRIKRWFEKKLFECFSPIMKSRLKSKHYRRMSVTLDIPIPYRLKTTPHQVQAILGRFILENPQILRQAFETSYESTTAVPALPITTEKQRKEMTLALQALGDDDLEWMDDIIFARRDKQYPPNFFND